MDFKFPGMWQFPTNLENCCIYRVPDSIRRVNPEAYTPQLVLLGPLNHSLRSEASKSLGDITNTKSTGYFNMEELKKIYLTKFIDNSRIRLGAETSINGFRSLIVDDEKKIRESYSESTAWIESHEFVNMILHDCVFILEVMLSKKEYRGQKTGDPLLDIPCLRIRVYKDLMILENQLPYFILNKLFHLMFPRQQFRILVLNYFRFTNVIRTVTEIQHFTDLFRCVRVAEIQEPPPREYKHINMYTAVKLFHRGVKFEAVEKELKLYVRFENNCLKMPCLTVDDGEEMKLRNIMAFEQCHVPRKAYICNYITFLDYLIDTEKDVDMLVEKGIIKNMIGQPSSVADMVNKLGLGIIASRSNYYSDITDRVTAYYSNPLTKAYSVLKNVYFSNVWIGTATVAAILLLLFTLIQAVCSVIQVLSEDDDKKQL